MYNLSVLNSTVCMLALSEVNSEVKCQSIQGQLLSNGANYIVMQNYKHKNYKGSITDYSKLADISVSTRRLQACNVNNFEFG